MSQLEQEVQVYDASAHPSNLPPGTTVSRENRFQLALEPNGPWALRSQPRILGHLEADIHDSLGRQDMTRARHNLLWDAKKRGANGLVILGALGGKLRATAVDLGQVEYGPANELMDELMKELEDAAFHAHAEHDMDLENGAWKSVPVKRAHCYVVLFALEPDASWRPGVEPHLRVQRQSAWPNRLAPNFFKSGRSQTEWFADDAILPARRAAKAELGCASNDGAMELAVGEISKLGEGQARLRVMETPWSEASLGSFDERVGQASRSAAEWEQFEADQVRQNCRACMGSAPMCRADGLRMRECEALHRCLAERGEGVRARQCFQ